LGANAIYFTPIFQSACNNRYHTHDYYQVDPLLGGNPLIPIIWIPALLLLGLLDGTEGQG
jgi:alpha amylase-like protein